MNNKYLSIKREKIGEIPTMWEFIKKVHINEINEQKMWETYLSIKNASSIGM